LFFLGRAFTVSTLCVAAFCVQVRGIVWAMGFFSRVFGGQDRGPVGPTATPTASSSSDRKRETLEHLSAFARSRIGVEAYIEPPNANEPVSILLIATTGEWTRRRVPTAADARKIAGDLGLPVYDVNFTGYPQRMRDWNSAHKRAH